MGRVRLERNPKMEARLTRLAKNEALFREVNERISEISQEVATGAANPELIDGLICECSDPQCLERVGPLTIAEYEFARSQNTYFVCLPGHEITAGGVGRVVRVAKTHVIVQKTGAAGEAARQRDPRAEEEERTG